MVLLCINSIYRLYKKGVAYPKINVNSKSKSSNSCLVIAAATPAEVTYVVPSQVSNRLVDVFHLVSPSSGAGDGTIVVPFGITTP